MSEYLLEKSRLTHQNISEANFHIFYYLLHGDGHLSEDLRQGPHRFDNMLELKTIGGGREGWRKEIPPRDDLTTLKRLF